MISLLKDEVICFFIFVLFIEGFKENPLCSSACIFFLVFFFFFVVDGWVVGGSSRTE